MIIITCLRTGLIKNLKLYDTLIDLHKSKIKIQKIKSSRFSQVLRRTGTDGSHEKERTAQHW